jgi:hypothetical protein
MCMAATCSSETKLHGVMNHKTYQTSLTLIRYHICCAHIASLVQQARIAIQSDAYLTRVVRLLLIMRFNDRKLGRMTRKTVKMETWVGTDGQGLYRVELHYNRIDRRRRHTLSHNLGLQSLPKCISHS